MGALTGLKAMKEKIEEQDAKFGDFGPKVIWVKLGDGKSLKFRPLQELDESSPNYDEARGLGQLNVEHSLPSNFMRKGLCSMEEQGQCYGCDQNWGQSLRFYLNVEVRGEEDFVAVLGQGNGPKSVTPTLIDYAEETGSITDKVFKLTRKGTGKKNTSWSAILLQETKEELPAYDLFDLKQIVRQIPFDEQEAHYNRVWKKKDDDDEHEPSGLDEFADKADDSERW